MAGTGRLLRRAAVVYNPVSGRGRAGTIAARAVEALRALGIGAEERPTPGPQGATALAASLAGEVDLLVVAGGDGSVREAIAGLGEHAPQLPVAVLPCGNANVLARELDIPLDVDGALRVLASSREVGIDLGTADGKLFLAMVGIGWDARTVATLDRLRATRWGRVWYRLWADSLYALAGVLALFGGARPRLRVEVDGLALPRRYRAIVIANLACYGKGWSMVPSARATSGRLHFQARHRADFPFVAWQLIGAMRKRQVPRFVSDYGEGERIVVRANAPFAIQVDGDPAGEASALEVRVVPTAARILVP